MMLPGDNFTKPIHIDTYLLTKSLTPLAPEHIETLRQCLNYFDDYEPYRLILLAACAARRIAKIYAISNSAIQKLGRDLHALARHTLPEISWDQAVASPEGQLIQIVDTQTRAVMADFLKRNSGENRHFHGESAKLQLREYWELEKKLLAALPDYAKLLKERPLGKMWMTEWSSGLLSVSLTVPRAGRNWAPLAAVALQT